MKRCCWKPEGRLEGLFMIKRGSHSQRVSMDKVRVETTSSRSSKLLLRSRGVVKIDGGAH
ncbi:hypothetical protein NECAME_07820 [Necator americanus]|uniref:Uncharacterized protein n=1 Tax=Necator americanus TaxID=51031 RepID=W2TL05_NECAM|nr:hypothetical protein NECAME_07820 [Necator americanus]ETN82760.1 hypothetical protein NECAME_07820 [Necator americanus]